MSKYGNRKTADGFDSRHERAVFNRLQLLMNAADPKERITEIERQVKFELIPPQRIAGKVIERACSYIADFRVRYADGRTEVIDAKGVKTKDYIIKRKLMLHVHGIQIREA